MSDPAAPWTPPAGWYYDHTGVLRWWTGFQWGPPAGPQAENSDERTWAILAHLGMFMLWFVGPLVIRQTMGRKSGFVRRHATEALNANLTLGLYWNSGPLLALILSHTTSTRTWYGLYVTLPIAFVWIFITMIRGVIAAHRGRPYRYPGAIRFVRGGYPKQPQTTTQM